VAATNDRAVDAARAYPGCRFDPAWMATEPHTIWYTFNGSAKTASSSFNPIDHRSEKAMTA
jgi:hypothetical protein